MTLSFTCSSNQKCSGVESVDTALLVNIFVLLLCVYTADNEASLNTENPTRSLFIEQICGDFKRVIVLFSFKFSLCTARTSEHCQQHLNKEEFTTSADSSPINTHCIWCPRCKLYILLL